MAGLLAASMVVVVLYCPARAFVPALRAPEHRGDLDLWHVLMGSAMAAMFLVPLTTGFSVVALAVFTVGVGYALLQTLLRIPRPAYLRLAVGCGAMSAMLLPQAAATAAPAGMDMAGMDMAGMDMGGTHGDPVAVAPVGSTVTVPTLVVAVLLAAIGVLLVVGLVHSVRRSRPAGERLDALCEVAMACAMGYMLLMMI
jgi:hypothetical protein